MKSSSLCMAFGLASFSLPCWSAPFSSCPAQAFLVQKQTAELYGVNLVSGYYESLSASMNTSGKLNAMGFNYHDDYLYAWSYQHQTLARIGSDYQVQPLSLSGTAPGTSFFVGDTAVSQNAHYLYRKGIDYGLYRIELAPESVNYLNWQRLVDGQQLSLSIYDFAFHPDNELLYSVDNQGMLWQIDSQTGDNLALGDVGQSGTFGAVYFDVEGSLYISRNSDGHIYRINPLAAEPQAEFFAQGPASSNNDGARCALAPIIDPASSQIDFGDAPDSYQTLLSSNGARHQLGVNGVRLGSKVDGESDAAVSPDSDDLQAPSDDEDGVYFVTSIQAGFDFIVTVQAADAGLLSAWIDFNQNQVFDSHEQILADELLSVGENSFLVSAPSEALEGETWSRFRVSSQAGLQPIGGAPDGEVEDHPVYVAAEGTQISFYPALGDMATVAFEDNWPYSGDYDLNDLVLKLHSRLISYTQSGEAGRIDMSGEISAMGASYRNGIGIRLPGVSRSQIDSELIRLELNGQLVEQPVLESGTQEAILLLTDNAKALAPTANGCEFFRTEVGCASQAVIPFKLYIPFVAGVAASSLPEPPYDPFIFAGTSREPITNQQSPRSLEIHLKNQAPTEHMASSFWGQGDDQSDPLSNLFFLNNNGLPWAVLIPTNWRHPIERVDVSQAYPKFIDYASSQGERSVDWYLFQHARPELVVEE